MGVEINLDVSVKNESSNKKHISCGNKPYLALFMIESATVYFRLVEIN
jgi:hypothetical protein